MSRPIAESTLNWAAQNFFEFFSDRIPRVFDSGKRKAVLLGIRQHTHVAAHTIHVHIKLRLSQAADKFLFEQAGDNVFFHLFRGLQPCGCLYIIFRHSVQRQHSGRLRFLAVFAVRCSPGIVGAPELLFLIAECFHDLTVNLRSLAGGLHAHHALAILGNPEVVIELDGCFGDSFHCLVLSAGSEQRMDKTKKEPHDGELIFPYR